MAFLLIGCQELVLMTTFRNELRSFVTCISKDSLPLHCRVTFPTILVIKLFYFFLNDFCNIPTVIRKVLTSKGYLLSQ